MGKKARAKKQQRGNGQTSAPADDRQAMADEEKAQMEVWCRLYIDSFQPLTELKEENRRMRRPLIPVRFSTLMDRHVKPTIYRETVEKIRQRLAGHPLFFSFSFSCNGSCNVNDYAEHIDAINVTVGTLNADKQRGEMFIVHSSENYSSIGKCDRDDDDYDDDNTSNSEFFIQLFKDTLNILFPEDPATHLKDIILLINEVDMYEVAVELIARMNLSVIHFTCLDSIIARCESLVGASYKKALRLVKLVVMYVHSYTIGDPSRGHESYGTLLDFENEVGLSQHFPKLSLAQNFIELSIYIFNNIDSFDKYFHLHEDITCEMLLKAVSDRETRGELDRIKKNFSSLLAAKQVIRSPKTASLQKTFTAVEEFRSKLRTMPREQHFDSDLIDSLFSDDAGYQTLLQYSRILDNEDPEVQQFLAAKLNLCLDYLKLFSYAPLTASSAVYFPNFTLLKQVSARVPINYLSSYSLIYSFQEETRRDNQAVVQRNLSNRILFYNNTLDFTC